jgi:hypothetical protein
VIDPFVNICYQVRFGLAARVIRRGLALPVLLLLLFSSTVLPAHAASVTICQEAEDGYLGWVWSVEGGDTTASNETYIVEYGYDSYEGPPDTDGQVSYSFSLPESGSYVLWGRVWATYDTDDSLWVQIDDGPWINWDNMVPANGYWRWDAVHNSDASDTTVVFDLDAGEHTLTFGYREDTTYLDKWLLTNVSGTPTGMGCYVRPTPRR